MKYTKHTIGVYCPQCGAVAGQLCRSATSKTSYKNYVHHARELAGQQELARRELASVNEPMTTITVMAEVPQNVIDAVKTLLLPFGPTFDT
jgi:hypothetical protein